MPLDDLVSVIETLQQRIATHRQSLQQNEIRTRTALIDPLLTALGWDVSDPALVTPEYSVSGGWADYALRGIGNQPAAIIEAKRLGSIVENHLSQMVNYCIQEGIAYAGVTDGSHWQLYRTFEPVPMADKIVLDVNLGAMPAYECALKSLILWHPNLSSGRAIPAEEPIFINANDISLPTRIGAESNPEETPLIAARDELSAGWVAISDFVQERGTDPPRRIRFPGGGEYRVQYWRSLVVTTAEWLWEKELLTERNVPVPSSNRRHVVNTAPKHPSGSDFVAPQFVSGTPLVVEGNISGEMAVQRVRILLNHCGIDPATVQLQVEQ